MLRAPGPYPGTGLTPLHPPPSRLSCAGTGVRPDAPRGIPCPDRTGSERQAAASDILTPRELQIAQLAAEGLANREIGKRLYISHRTVGARLAKIYAKLVAASRVQLHNALGNTGA